MSWYGLIDVVVKETRQALHEHSDIFYLAACGGGVRWRRAVAACHEFDPAVLASFLWNIQVHHYSEFANFHHKT